jgi:hypothetical protein
MTSFSKIEQNVESLTGLSVDKIRWYSPDELRKYFETRNDSKLTFTSEFPAIGRGNVLREGIIDSDTINNDIDKILFGK